MNHSFDVAVAKEVGVLAAAIFNSIGFWIVDNSIHHRNCHDGRYWVFNSVSEWSDHFPYASRKQTETALTKLRDAGYLDVGDFNADRRNRTLWYTLTAKGYEAFGIEIPEGLGACIPPNGEMDVPKRGNEYIYTSITDMYTVSSNGQFPKQDGIQQQMPLDVPKKKQPKRKTFVPPTPEMVSDFAESIGEHLDGEYFCDYYAAIGWKVGNRPMKDWKATVRNWIRRNKQRGNGYGQGVANGLSERHQEDVSKYD